MAKILLVEDDNNLREIYEARLQAEGYDIVSARDGEEALTIAMKERPDLIISDVMMPKISGFDMLDIIRSTEETKNVKVIMMTALSQAEDKERASKLGADRYLVKSQVTLEDVAKVAREVLNGESDQNSAPVPTTGLPAVMQTSTTTTPAPAVVATPVDEPTATVVNPAPEPTVSAAPTPVVANNSSTTAPVPAGLGAVAPAQDDDTTTDDSDSAVPTATTTDTSPIEQSVEDEQSAIAAQIESFIDAKKTDSEVATETEATPVTAVEQPTGAEPTPTPEAAAVETQPTPEPISEPMAVEVAPITAGVIQPDASGEPSQKVIQPLTDPTASKSSELNRLLEQEQEKERMAEIAKSVLADNATFADPAATESAPTQGTMPEPAFIETPAQPVIPHSNGVSMDGVVPPIGTNTVPAQPEPKANESADPDNISL